MIKTLITATLVLAASLAHADVKAKQTTGRSPSADDPTTIMANPPRTYQESMIYMMNTLHFEDLILQSIELKKCFDCFNTAAENVRHDYNQAVIAFADAFVSGDSTNAEALVDKTLHEVTGLLATEEKPVK